MDNQNAAQKSPLQTASMHQLNCPACGAKDFTIIGSKGAKGKSIGISAAFGAVGALAANAMAKDDYSIEPVGYKCKACKKKFESLPLTASPEELLEEPCQIVFERMSAFAGIAVSQTVWLNGVKVASVKNKQTVEFPTFVKHNTIFVTDQFGVAFKGHYTFEAQPGGKLSVKFKRKFVHK